MGPRSQYLETVLTCMGDYYSPDFYRQLSVFREQLQRLIFSGWLNVSVNLPLSGSHVFLVLLLYFFSEAAPKAVENMTYITWCSVWHYCAVSVSFYGAMLRRAQSCYEKSSVCLSVRLSVYPSVRLSVCNVQVPWSHRLEFLENNFTAE